MKISKAEWATLVFDFDQSDAKTLAYPLDCERPIFNRSVPGDSCPHYGSDVIAEEPDPHKGTAEAIGAALDELLPPAQAPNPIGESHWFARYLAGDKQARKEAPIARGLHGYFPNACVYVSHVSFVANEQHNPGQPMQWAFGKSTDHADCQVRHAIDAMAPPGDPRAFDDDGLLHLAKKAWRANAELETYLLENYPDAKPGASVTGFERKAK